MKKIMFDDRFGLTQAVLDGRKTMTRRVIPAKAIEYILGEFKQEYFEATLDVFDSDKKYIEQYYLVEKCGKCFRPGDIVAVAQSYESIRKEMLDGHHNYFDDVYEPFHCGKFISGQGYHNKMFVRADLMPHQIRITSVRIERIQDISGDDCLREGIIDGKVEPKLYGFKNGKHYDTAHTPREAFAILIKKMAGKKAWDDNPWVFVYEFELIR